MTARAGPTAELGALNRLELERHLADVLVWLGPNPDLARRVAESGPDLVRDYECRAIADAAVAAHRRADIDPERWVYLVAGELEDRGGDPRWLFGLGTITRGFGRGAVSASHAVDELEARNRTARASTLVADAISRDPTRLADRLRDALELLEAAR
jgi:hypothetical protein